MWTQQGESPLYIVIDKYNFSLYINLITLQYYHLLIL